MVHLIGPGGAGKTTVGAALAERRGVRFVDLDAEFAARHGNISAYLDTHGYEAYAEQNVGVYFDLASGPVRPGVVALSSGFMTYREGIHHDYVILRQRIASSPWTFVLLPSVDLELCVNEIVRRQLQRPFARSAEREEQVIRERFSIYMGLPARKVDTMQPTEVIVTELAAVLAAAPLAARDWFAIVGTRNESRSRRVTLMKKSGSTWNQTASAVIDKRIAALEDWRGETLSIVRKLIHDADPDVVEEVKWRKPSNAMLGIPVWSHDGIICTGETYKDKVKLTFSYGASLRDPGKLFNSSLDGHTRRAIDIHEGEKVDARAFKALVRAAVDFNTARGNGTPRARGKTLGKGAA